MKFPLKVEEIPALPPGVDFGGNEIEGILVRALRVFELQAADAQKPLSEILKSVVKDMKPSAHTRKLEYMDLVAVRECTDAGFLPPKFATMAPEEVEARMEELRRFV